MCWDLSVIYKDESSFCKKSQQIKKDILEFYNEYKSLVDYDGDKLEGLLRKYESVMEDVLKAQLYKSLLYYSGNDIHGIEPIVDEIMDMYNEYDVSFPLYLIEFDFLGKYLASSNDSEYRLYMKNLQCEKKYILNRESEMILHQKNSTGYNAMQQLYLSTLEDSKFIIRGIGKVDYNFILGLLNCNKKEFREKAAQKIGHFFCDNNAYFSNLFNYLVQDMEIDKRIRGYSTIYDYILKENELTKKDFSTLEQQVVKNLCLFRRYYSKKSSCMNSNSKWGTHTIHNLTKRIDIDEAIEIIVEAFNGVSPEYGDIVKDLYENNYIDYECREGKQAGAICFAAVPSVKPYIFINYSGTVSDLFTLAHELGHAIHFVVSARKNTMVDYIESNLHSESIAVMFETIVCNEYLKRYNNDFDVLEVLDNYIGKIFRQSMNYFFEKRAREYGGYATPDDFEEEWKRIRNLFYADTVKFHKYEKNNYWSVPHFICEPLLTSVYVFSQVIAINLIEKFKKKKWNGLKTYLEMGSNESFMKLLNNKFDIRIDREKEWFIAFYRIEEILSGLEK